MTTDRQHVHQLIDQLDPGQFQAIAQLLEVMVDPVARSLSRAPIEDQPVSHEEAALLDAAHDSIRLGGGTSHEEILREFGLR
jgi:hypothetical protein